ncbi:MAG: hypothetical protein D6742_20150 [Cyanobacteria bacterium J069]|nr:MAG: hypothetical protein D6742_20150 [Cyanobacteria bacterium J069]
MDNRFDIQFEGGAVAVALRAEAGSPLPQVLDQLGLVKKQPVLVVVGGAGKLSREDQAQVRSLFVKVLAPLAEALGAAVIDGGTDAGIMRMMGQARRRTRSRFPLVGVAPECMAILPGSSAAHADAAPLEPNHTHFVLVPGTYWGDESIWIAQLASVLSDGLPSLTVLINGGEVTWNDASQNVGQGRPLLVIAGSGRTADALAAALEGKITDERARRIVASGLMQSVDLRSSEDLARIIHEMLSA